MPRFQGTNSTSTSHHVRAQSPGDAQDYHVPANANFSFNVPANEADEIRAQLLTLSGVTFSDGSSIPHDVITSYTELSNPNEYTINVRLTGNDATGDGSLAKPYATIHRALQDVPTFIPSSEVYSVDITDMGVIDLTEYMELTLANYQGYADGRYDYVNNWRASYGSLNIQAQPTVIDTITEADVTGITVDPNSALRTLQTTKSWTASAYKGAIALGPDGSIEAYAIADNTTTDLKLCAAYDPEYPLQIVVPSAELLAGPNAYYALGPASSSALGTTICNGYIRLRNNLIG